jgi:tRNA-binding protein
VSESAKRGHDRPEAERPNQNAGQDAPRSTPLSWDEFSRVDMRVGRIVAVEEFPQARKPAWKLTVDFGAEIGERRSSAQITNYAREQLLGRNVVGVVNFPDKQIGPFVSQCLVLGTYTPDGLVLLLDPAPDAALGDRVG